MLCRYFTYDLSTLKLNRTRKTLPMMEYIGTYSYIIHKIRDLIS